MARVYNLYLLHWLDIYQNIYRRPTWLVSVPQLPGCAALGFSEEEALARVREAVGGHLRWLQSHGEAAEARNFDVKLAGRAGPETSGSSWDFWPEDQEPMEKQEFPRLLHYMAWLREDLLNKVKALRREVFDWRHPDPTLYPMTVRELLRHIARIEWWYVTRIVEAMPEPDPLLGEDSLIYELLEEVRRAAVNTLLRLKPEDLFRVFVPEKLAKPRGEPWTVRKVFRRILEHERLHAAEVSELLAEYQRLEAARP